MKNVFFVLLLAVGCSIANKPRPVEPTPAPKPTVGDVVFETMKPEALPHPTVVLTPVEVTSTGVMVLRPAVKYSVVGLEHYKKYIPRVEKFFQLLVNDKSILDGKVFDYNTDSADTIRAKIMRGFDVTIQPFTPPWYLKPKWRKTIAYHEDWTIYLHSSRLNRPDCDIIDTIAHESTHAWGYGHGDDSSVGKDLAFPYWAGELARTYCLAGKI